MAKNRRFGFDETKFRPGQREAALALVEYEFEGDRTKRKTKQEIADEIGISRQQLHAWNTRDQNFIAYKNYLASEFLDSHLAFVYRKMLEGIDKGSMKGIELYLKRIGDLDNRSEITVNQGDNEQSFEERKAAILERLNGEINDDKE